MKTYDYLESVKADVLEYINDNGLPVLGLSRDELAERLYDECWTADSVTGNGSGSYTFSRWQAEENLCHNLDLLGEALSEFGCDADYLTKQGPEACDVTIRCYLLPQAISEVLDELNDDEL